MMQGIQARPSSVWGSGFRVFLRFRALGLGFRAEGSRQISRDLVRRPGSFVYSLMKHPRSYIARTSL